MGKNNNSKYISIIIFSPFGNTLKIGEYIQKILTESNQQCKFYFKILKFLMLNTKKMYNNFIFIKILFNKFNR